MDFAVILEQDAAGFFVAEVPSLPGCYSQGRSRDEALANIRDAIRICLDETGPGVAPRSVSIETISVEP